MPARWQRLVRLAVRKARWSLRGWALGSAEISAVHVADGQRATQALRRDPDCVAAARGLKRLRALAAAKEAGNAAFKAGDWRAAHAQYSAALVHNTPGSGNAAFMAQCACNRCAPPPAPHPNLNPGPGSAAFIGAARLPQGQGRGANLPAGGTRSWPPQALVDVTAA